MKNSEIKSTSKSQYICNLLLGNDNQGKESVYYSVKYYKFLILTVIGNYSNLYTVRFFLLPI